MDELGHVLAQGLRLIGYAVLTVVGFYVALLAVVMIGSALR